jgi:hypothetical protein
MYNEGFKSEFLNNIVDTPHTHQLNRYLELGLEYHGLFAIILLK